MRAMVMGAVLAIGCAPSGSPCPAPDRFLGEICDGACSNPGQEVCSYPGSGRGCVCFDGCWVDFWDGPCQPRPDVPPPDVGPLDAGHDAGDFDASDAEASPDAEASDTGASAELDVP